MAKVQVKKGHYDFIKYVSLARWNSYYYQIINALDESIHTILLIGIGDGVVVDTLRKCGKEVVTFDFDKSLNPDIYGSVTEIETILKKKYDCIMCCQVLEHLPFSEFEKVIEQFSHLVNEKVIVSLPYCRKRIFLLNMFAPKIHTVHGKILIPQKLKHGFRFDVEGGGEHYWELGIEKKENSRKNVRKVLQKYMGIEKEFNPIENVYHVFYILKPKSDKK